MTSTSWDPSCSVPSLFLWCFPSSRYHIFNANGHKASYLARVLFDSQSLTILCVCVCLWLQILFPLGKISVMIYGCLASIIFCAYIVYDTDNLIKRHSYDEYIWAAVSLYLDVINLFLSLLTLLRAADS